MSAVTIDEAWPGFGSAFTVAELDRMPDDGHRYELLDGASCEAPADDNPPVCRDATGQPAGPVMS